MLKAANMQLRPPGGAFSFKYVVGPQPLEPVKCHSRIRGIAGAAQRTAAVPLQRRAGQHHVGCFRRWVSDCPTDNRSGLRSRTRIRNHSAHLADGRTATPRALAARSIPEPTLPSIWRPAARRVLADITGIDRRSRRHHAPAPSTRSRTREFAHGSHSERMQTI